MSSKKQAQIITAKVVSSTPEGHGIVDYNGQHLVLPYSVPGDEVAFNSRFPEKYQVVKPSEYRQNEIPCPYYFQCGGCGLQHFTYEGQLVFKQLITSQNLKTEGVRTNVDEVAAMHHPWRYRNKMAFSFYQHKNKIYCGLIDDELNQVIQIDDCLLHHKAAHNIVEIFKKYIIKHRIPVYNNKTGEGIIRHLVIKYSTATGEFMVIVVSGSRTQHLPAKDDLIQMLNHTDKHITSVYLNLNFKTGGMVLGNKFIHLWGEHFISDTIDGLKFKVLPGSFFQINKEQTIILYSKILKAANLTGNQMVYDLYCGVGTISLFLARYAKKVVAIESSSQSVAAAIENAQINNIKNVDFYTGKVEKAIFYHFQHSGKPDVVILDPPRKGCEYAVLKALIDAMPRKIIYVSCNPASMAADLKILSKKYYVSLVEPVDMFPHTLHIENVATLILKNPNH